MNSITTQVAVSTNAYSMTSQRNGSVLGKRKATEELSENEPKPINKKEVEALFTITESLSKSEAVIHIDEICKVIFKDYKELFNLRVAEELESAKASIRFKQNDITEKLLLIQKYIRIATLFTHKEVGQNDTQCVEMLNMIIESEYFDKKYFKAIYFKLVTYPPMVGGVYVNYELRSFENAKRSRKVQILVAITELLIEKKIEKRMWVEVLTNCTRSWQTSGLSFEEVVLIQLKVGANPQFLLNLLISEYNELVYRGINVLQAFRLTIYFGATAPSRDNFLRGVENVHKTMLLTAFQESSQILKNEKEALMKEREAFITEMYKYGFPSVLSRLINEYGNPLIERCIEKDPQLAELRVQRARWL